MNFKMAGLVLFLGFNAFAQPPVESTGAIKTPSDLFNHILNKNSKAQIPADAYGCASSEEIEKVKASYCAECVEPSTKFIVSKWGQESAPYVDRIKSSGVETCQMTDAELLAIAYYTGDGYRVLNQSLRQQENLEEVKPVITLVNSGLDKLKSYRGYVRRGTNMPAEFLAQHEIGADLIYTGYTSTSLGDGFSAQYKLVIFSQTCKYLDPISSVKGENEVLCKPGTQFHILHQEGNTFLMYEKLANRKRVNTH